MESAALLRSRNIKPTLVRLKVYEYLAAHKNHPTADTIYKALQDDIPTLSKTSIYNTAGLLLKNHLIRTVSIEENEIRYDAVLSDHGHFKCTLCSEVYDFKLNRSASKHKLPENFMVTERQILYKGICSRCQNKTKV